MSYIGSTTLTCMLYYNYIEKMFNIIHKKWKEHIAVVIDQFICISSRNIKLILNLKTDIQQFLILPFKPTLFYVSIAQYTYTSYRHKLKSKNDIAHDVIIFKYILGELWF